MLKLVVTWQCLLSIFPFHINTIIDNFIQLHSILGCWLPSHRELCVASVAQNVGMHYIRHMGLYSYKAL